MSQYVVHFFCYECNQTHPLGISIGLDDGPPDKASIGDAYAGKELPTQVAMLTNNQTTCPVTEKLTSQADHYQVFLVPVD